ncbi:hypothetical protein LMH87_006374 [Akanthomyces muscarius]|uniref:Uncharacterized protein n=1 Tax=Akanthomyces muscarius TaxID=2231603 RepID=A0A9W8QQS0_AKAMU|nr:hypothetical protein LMH87_006374 [Akanthomyces muscarius]KAJ4164712.1 hypothetical protein LMH87_006374 [Akanthomyces muscarius]
MFGNLFHTTALLLVAAAQTAAAQRGDASICDYYAKENYGDDSMESQLKLMTGIVAFAYAGGDDLDGADKNSSGIFKVGSIGNDVVYLRPYFDGTMNTTNLNDQAVALNWLDGGGVAPLQAFINGTTNTADIKKGTNQYTLFTHWTLMPAYVHKYMDLNKPKIAYFIRQITLASKFYGFSDADASSLELYMNNRYNNQCAPAELNMLNSICFAKDCPHALPKADCNAYSTIKPYGVDDNYSQTPTPSATGTSSTSSSSAAKSDLGGGAIAGIVVGALAGVGLVIGALWFFFKKKGDKSNLANRPESTAPSHTTGGYHNSSMYSPAMTQSHYDMTGQYDINGQAHYDPNRQSQFSYFPGGQESYTGTNSPAPRGWSAQMPPQELHATEIGSTPTSPSPQAAADAHVKSEYKPDVRQLIEMESPHPALDHSWTPSTPREEREESTAPRPESNTNHHQ